MTKTEYLEKRNDLMAQSEAALASNKPEEAQELMDKVSKLDNDFKEMAEKQANFNALKDAPAAMMNAQSEEQQMAKALTSVTASVTKSAPRYDHVWAKSLLGNTLSSEEQAVFDKENKMLNADFSHSTTNTPTLIPNTVVEGIWKIAEEQYPLLADTRKFNVRGTLKINKHDGIVSGDAQWVDEDARAEDEQNKFSQLILKGFELNKVATITLKMKAMSESDFISFIQREIAERVGVALGICIVRGTGANSLRAL